MLKLYNTLTRKKETFKPIKPREAGIYSCGLTVYGFGHIGNYRAFITADILKRTLEFLGYKVIHVTNITDVDDKTIKNSIQQKKTLKQYTEPYTKAFFEDCESLNIEKSDFYPKATEHIKEMVEIIKKLLEKEIAYKTEDGIYFNIKKFKDYGKLAGIKTCNLKAGASKRVLKDEYDKDNVQDFALWKFWTKQDGDVFWETEIGKGRPGWHIECSAMSSKYLGNNFDIHTGGIDLVFPHHQNEIAQSEASSEEKFVNYWVHNEWLLVDGKKMSKSLGNFYTLRDIINKGYNPLYLRYFYLTSSYRKPLDFTFENLENAKNSLERLKNIINENKDDKKTNKEYLDKFKKAIEDDLNAPQALAILWELVRDEKAEGKIEAIKKIDSVLGLNLLKKEKLEIPEEIKKLADEREKARKNKDFKKSDELRNKLKQKGWQVDDALGGQRLKKI
ncbi:cysteine--tRNA ligase [Candidatus Woesearchaeota archaeon CG10_big_fil_rev_8_21_14_0_10_34_12]|nr:MAG: cysteine--tRNA ligase [Candidatus Woesearchaeota archaeon CG10_big_fil_rev_8_21_14_0_10_34_12]